jgi:hypothetical protein
MALRLVPKTIFQYKRCDVNADDLEKDIFFLGGVNLAFLWHTVYHASD